MSKEEIISLKEEFFSEIRNLEKHLNLQVSIKLKELNDENDKKKTETKVVSHDIRFNTVIKDINELKFNQSKILSENLTIPVFVGFSFKYKSISNYIDLNITDIDKLKNETDQIRKKNKEIKRKIENMIKTVLNLVDKSN